VRRRTLNYRARRQDEAVVRIKKKIGTVAERRCLPLVVLLLATAGLQACATSAPSRRATLTLEQHSLRIPLTVEADGSVSLADHPPLIGRLDLSPILQEEKVAPGAKPRLAVQIMLHYGRIYVVSRAFRSMWEITPRPGTTSASYRPAFLVRAPGAAPVKDLRLSRYGSARSSCLRLDRVGGAPIFITPMGEARDACP
jgi:hypothetical protein